MAINSRLVLRASLFYEFKNLYVFYVRDICAEYVPVIIAIIGPDNNFT